MKNSAEEGGEGVREKGKPFPQHFYPFFFFPLQLFFPPSSNFCRFVAWQVYAANFREVAKLFRVFPSCLYEQIVAREFKCKCLRDFYYNLSVFKTFYFWKSHFWIEWIVIDTKNVGLYWKRKKFLFWRFLETSSLDNSSCNN